MSDFTDFFASGGGNITERISYYADGRTIAANQGNITVPNITATTDITSTTTVDWPGTNIDYTPPAGTKYVHYNAFNCEIVLFGTNVMLCTPYSTQIHLRLYSVNGVFL